MKRNHISLLLIILCGLVLRLGLLPLVQTPGLNDQNHYYNLGRRLLDGEGMTIDYIWHFNDVPKDIVNPVDHWMPLPGIAVLAGMQIAGENARAALIIFIAAGTLLPALSYWAAKQLELSDSSALFAAAFTACIPDLLSYSLRADTSIINAFLTSLCILLLTKTLQQGKYWHLLASGFCAGLAYLNRNDSILLLPISYVVALIYWRWSKAGVSKNRLFLVALLFTLFFTMPVIPWLIRNQIVLGRLGTAEGNRMFFMVDAHEHYAYNTPINLDTMLAQRTIPELLYKRAFEFAAAIKQVFNSLSWIGPLFLLSFYYLYREGEKLRFLALIPTFIWLLAIFIAYPIFIPLKSQSGSFEKAFLGILPLLIPQVVFVLEKAFSKWLWRLLIAVVGIALMIWQGIGIVTEENAFANRYYSDIGNVISVISSLPDITGDDQIRLMSQDPFVLSYYGYSSLMIPLASREEILELAARFDIDYILMPAARPALDALYLRTEQDTHFVFATRIVRDDGRYFELYGLYPHNSDNED
jgi:hypothetical protein